MKLTKLVWHFFDFSMIFGEFCKIFVFYKKKRKTKEKEKDLHGLGPAHNEAGPTARIQPRLRKKAHGERPTQIWTFDIRNPNLFQKLLRSSHIFFLFGIFISGIP
jgi:hypothetical protein